MPTGFKNIIDFFTFGPRGTIYQVGTLGRDNFIPPDIADNVRLVQVGGEGDDIYNPGIPTSQQLRYSFENDGPWAVMYSGARPGFGHPEAGTYGGKGTIASKDEIDADQANIGWGTFANLGRGADDFIFHGGDLPGGVPVPKGFSFISTVVWQPYQGDQMFMNNSDKSRGVEDGFRFYDPVVKIIDDDTAQLLRITARAYADHDRIDTQTVELTLTDSLHGGWRPTKFQYDGESADGEARELAYDWIDQGLIV